MTPVTNAESSEPADTPLPPADAAWRRATQQANALFSRSDKNGAQRLYDTATKEARIIFAKAWSGQASLAPIAAPMMVVSVANSARNRVLTDDFVGAEKEFIDATELFFLALESVSCSRDLKRACLSHLPRLVAEMVAICHKGGGASEAVLLAAERAQALATDLLYASQTH